MGDMSQKLDEKIEDCKDELKKESVLFENC